MVRTALSVLLLSSLGSLTFAMPHEKRINQQTIDSTKKWQDACLTAATNAADKQKCNPIAVTGASTLLANAGPCDQQNSGDAMVDLAKTFGNDPNMIKFAQIFIQQPRNAPDSLQVRYCEVAPKNTELNGFFHCQFAGSKFPNFSGDGTGTVPLGLTSLKVAGACPANPGGPVADGTQLTDIVNDPGIPIGSPGSSFDVANGGAPVTPTTSKNKNKNKSTDAPSATPSSDTAGTPTSAVLAAATSSSAGDFKLQNGKDAIDLNAKFATLTANSPCNNTEQACVNSQFAQCVGTSFQLTACGSGTICAALPLVNKKGTSITCTTAEDRDRRIAATGATSGN